MRTDRYGLPLSTTSDTAIEAYQQGQDFLLAAWPGGGAAFERAIAADPGFALAHIGRARLHQVQGEIAEARTMAARARELVAGATARERGHVDVLASSIEGQPGRALTLAEAHLDAFPRDAIIMLLLLGAFGLYAFSGRADHDQARVRLCERHARHYGEDWWFLTYLGWSHTEAGHVGAGRHLTERSLALRRENANGAHALAHALFEQGDGTTAEAFLADWLPLYDRSGTLHGHIHWHLSLLALDAGDAERALRLYAETFCPAASLAPALNRLSDGAALLWRMGLDDVAPAAAWRDVAAYGAHSFANAGIHFADLHAALAAAATGDAAALARRAEQLDALAAERRLAPGGVVPALCRAFGVFAAGDHAGAARMLEPLMPEAVRVGGSHAQRELIEDTLIVAWLRAGEAAKARDALAERLRRRPSRRDARWLARAESRLGSAAPV